MQRYRKNNRPQSPTPPIPLFSKEGVQGELCGIKRLTAHALRLPFLTLFTFHFSLFTDAHAAPHVTRGKPEPPSRVGKHLSERMKAKMFAPMLANATTGPVK